MCGLCGAVGEYNPQIVKTLMILNEDRGRDSTGLYSAKPTWMKHTKSSKAWLRDPEPHKFIQDSLQYRGVYAHTRASTRGSVCTDNAHPFEFGPIIGAHNGVLPDAPAKYAVDSMYAFDLLSQSPPGAYQKALKDLTGWYMLIWHDSRDGKTYFLNWNGDLSFAKHDSAIYYSSLDQHLWTATGIEPQIKTKSGDVWVWDGKAMKQEKKSFVGGNRWANRNTGYQNTQNNTLAVVGSRPTGTDRWDESFTGEIMRMGKAGVWCGGRKNGTWSVLERQELLHGIYPSAVIGCLYKLKDVAILIKKEEEKGQLTDSEMEKRRDEIIRDADMAGFTQAQTEAELEKAGLA